MFLIAFPSGGEMFILLFILTILFTFPILTIVLFLKNRALKEELQKLAYERDELRRKLNS